MSYQHLHTNLDNLEFIKNNYSNQIIALNFIYEELERTSILKSAVHFGGGTALAIYYFNHRRVLI